MCLPEIRRKSILGELIVMGVKNIIQAVKMVHTEYIVLVKEGSFYHIYGKDAYIISYLFGYKIKKIENVLNCSYLAMERMLKKQLILKII